MEPRPLGRLRAGQSAGWSHNGQVFGSEKQVVLSVKSDDEIIQVDLQLTTYFTNTSSVGGQFSGVWNFAVAQGSCWKLARGKDPTASIIVGFFNE